MENVTAGHANQRVIDFVRATLDTAFPGKVTEYDADNQKAKIEIQTRRSGEELPILQSVPVVWPRGGISYLHLPLEVGDFGLVICCKDDIGAWRARGVAGDPGERGLHGLQNAVFIPGLVPRANTIDTATGATILAGGDVRLGTYDAAQQVLCGNDFEQALNTWQTAMSTWLNTIGALAVTQLGMDPADNLTMTTANTAFYNAVLAALSPSVRVEEPFGGGGPPA